MEYIYLGYEKKEYVNKEGKTIVGYNLFYAYTGDNHIGYKPAMRYNGVRKSLGYCYLSEFQFDKLACSQLTPLSKVYMTWNQFGGVENIRATK